MKETEQINLSLNIMTLRNISTKDIANAIEEVSVDIRDRKKEGCVKIKDKTIGYWKFKNTFKDERFI